MDQSSEGPSPSVPPRWASARSVAVPDEVAVDATVADPIAPPPEPDPVPVDHDPVAHGARSHPASLRGSFTSLVVAAVLLAGVSAARLLPDWERERWWVVPVIALPLAALAGFVALVRAISGAGEARRRAHMSGAPIGVALAVLSTLVLAGVALRGVDDWNDLDIPAAWDRLRENTEAEPRDPPAIDDEEEGAGEMEDGTPLGGIVGQAEDAITGSPEELRTTGWYGACWTGTPTDPGQAVDCEEPHRLQVSGQVILEGAPNELDAAARHSLAVTACEESVDPPDQGGVTDAVVPDDIEWAGGLRDALCVTTWAQPITGL